MKKWKCQICDEELSEDEIICPSCGSYVEEPAYDAMDDEDEE